VSVNTTGYAHRISNEFRAQTKMTGITDSVRYAINGGRRAQATRLVGSDL
jgi:hypothetical protein